MRKKLILILISLVVILLFSQNQIFAASTDYVINAYSIDMNVTEDNIFEITEIITVNFNVPKHGIIRKVPLKNTVKRADGTMSINKAQVTKVDVDTDYSTSNDGSYYSIKIGSASETITGSKTYTIKYTYNIGNDPSKDYDELYYNLIGTEWDAPIEKVGFRITMPKKFDSNKLGFSVGDKGSSGFNTNNLIGSVVENVITGTYTKGLSPKQGITVRLELPEGYFKKQALKIDFIDALIFVLPIVFVIVAYVLWNKYGRDEQVVDSVEFYPPEGLNSLDVARIYYGKAEQKHVLSLLTYLASKGYIKIVEKENKTIIEEKDYTDIDSTSEAKKEFLRDMYEENLEKGSFEIVKLKDYDGDNEDEKMFMSRLFLGNKKVVTENELTNHFYMTIDKILQNTNSKENKDKIYRKESGTKKIYFAIMIIITLALFITRPLIESNININTNININKTMDLIFELGPVLIYIILLILSIFKCKKIIYKIVFTIIGMLVGAGILYSKIGAVVAANPTYLAQNIIGIICLIIVFIFMILMKNRTEYGNKMYGKIKGFKNFLETAEKDKLEAMVNDNPTYFYDILPYTYALDISDIWINKFETIALRPPEWYEYPDISKIIDNAAFSIEMIIALNNTMNEINIAMTSMQKMYANSLGGFSDSDSSGINSSGGGTGFSGGGFSGGGSGGGGGSSW